VSRFCSKLVCKAAKAYKLANGARTLNNIDFGALQGTSKAALNDLSGRPVLQAVGIELIDENGGDAGSRLYNVPNAKGTTCVNLAEL